MTRQRPVRARAPLRLSFAGGGTDVSPYLEEHGGAVISATIQKYAYGTLSPRDDDTIEVRSLDLDTTARFDTDEEFTYGGDLDLVKVVLDNFSPEQGLDMFLHSDVPPGSGLGSSSTVMVALIGLFRQLQHLGLSDYETAELAYKLERIDLGLEGGKQDQYAASFGGFNFIEFRKDETIVNPLKIPRELLNELSYRFLIAYTGTTRLSGNIIAEQKDRAEKGQNVEALDAVKELAVEIKEALVKEDLSEFGELMHQGWEHKKKFASKITSPEIDSLYETARDHGAIGGKISGAGGGGFMMLFCEAGRKHEVARALRQAGAEPEGVAFDLRGLEMWDGHV